MIASREDLIDILKDVVLDETPGAAALGRRLAAGLKALAETFSEDTELAALARSALGQARAAP